MRKFREDFSALLQRMRCVTALCVLCLLLAAGTARAAVGDVFKVDGITYKVLTTSTLQVGDETNAAISPEKASCAIPETVTYGGTSYTVTSIGDKALYCCSWLTSVTFPASLTSIKGYAYSGCEKLTGFIVSSDNPAFCAVDGVLFSKDKTRLIAYPDGKTGISYVIPNSVTSIGNYAFAGSGLTSVTFPASLTSIEKCAFLSCSLTSLTLPESLTSIGDNAFAFCSYLTSVTFPASLTSIGDRAFLGCRSLKAFLVAPENRAFCVVDGVLFSQDKTRLVAYPNGKIGTSYVIPDNVTSIGSSAFYHCSCLTSVTFPTSLTSIGNEAFYGCRYLISMTSPQSLKSIGDRAFYECTGLTVLTFPASLTSIGNEAFFGCSGLTSVAFPATSSLTSIGNKAFSQCERITSVTFPASLTSIGAGAFYGCNGLVYITYLGTHKPSINDAFLGGPSNRVLYIPNAKDGFDTKDWGAFSILYGYSK